MFRVEIVDWIKITNPVLGLKVKKSKQSLKDAVVWGYEEGKHGILGVGY